MELFGFDVPLWLVLLVVIGLLLYLHGTWTYGVWAKQGIKGPMTIPYIGNTWYFMKKGSLYASDIPLREKYGKIIGGYAGRRPDLQVCDPELLRKTMIKEFNSMPNRQRGGSRKDVLGMFLTALEDDHWRHVRSALTPTFTSGKLKQMKSLIDACGAKLVTHIKKKAGQPFDTKTYAGGFTLDVICSTAFGIETDSLGDPDAPILRNANAVMNINSNMSLLRRIRFTIVILLFFILPSRVFNALERFGIRMFNLEGFNYFMDLCEKILDSRVEENTTSRKDFVELCKSRLITDPDPKAEDSMIDASGAVWSKSGLTKNEIIANAILFFLAGYETTASTLAFVFYELAMNPEIQERAYEEIMSNSSADYPSYDELSKMEYLDWIMEESLRLYPAAARVDRITNADLEIDGIHIPCGSSVTAMIYAIHMDPEIWPNPTKFDPERYAPENKADRHQCAWIPFGIGNRNCIGMRLALLEMKIAVVQVLKAFQLKQGPTTMPKPVKFATNFRNSPVKPLEVIAQPRDE